MAMAHFDETLSCHSNTSPQPGEQRTIPLHASSELRLVFGHPPDPGGQCPSTVPPSDDEGEVGGDGRLCGPVALWRVRTAVARLASARVSS